MKYRHFVITNTMSAFAEVKHSVSRAVNAVWYHVFLLLAFTYFVSRTREMTLMYLQVACCIIVFRWLVVLNAYLQYKALREALYRSAHISHAVKVGSFQLLCINGVWFKFSRVKANRMEKWTFDLFERTYVEGGVV